MTMRRIGSQLREPLAESGYKLIRRAGPGCVLLESLIVGIQEYWYANDDHAGYTIQVGRWGYEFGSEVVKQ